MKISFNWLKDYVDLPQDIQAAEVANKLTFAGLEVESCTSLAKGFDKIFVGQILERKQHPNADRLSLCTIDVGTALSPSGEKLEIVCGAQNIKAGQKIPVATLGAVIPSGLEIKAAKIRGVASCGMLCSLDELLLPKEWQKEDGIFILKEDSTIGMPMAQYLERDDWLLEINITANRGDALSHMGIAREVAALYGFTAKLPEIKSEEESKSKKYSLEVVNNAGPELCPTYHAKLIEGVKVAPSPEWLRKKIESVGLRSINNIVDITSFVMFEMGQPLHAFDADKLVHDKNKIKISIRTAKEGENFTSLSDKEVKLVNQDIVIASGETGEKAVALAGVMGGKNSEVNDETVNVLLEAAEFSPVNVRKTGRRLALLTDAGYRFERGVDSGKVEWAMARAASLLKEFTGAKVQKTFSLLHLESQPAQQIRLRASEVQKVLGKAPETSIIISILRSLGIAAEIAPGEKEVIQVQIPKWRKDLHRSIDLVEEIVRIWGFTHIDSKLPLSGIGEVEPKASKRRSYFQLRRIRRHLTSLGFYEALNYGFSSPEELSKLLNKEELTNVVQIINPVSNDYSVLKPNLLPGLIKNIVLNFSHKKKNLRFFEVRKVFSAASNTLENDSRLETGVEEKLYLSIALTGEEVDEFWQGKAPLVDFYSIKGIVDSIFGMLGKGGIQYDSGVERSYLHPGQSAVLKQGEKKIGIVGKLHPKVEKEYGLDQDIFIAELDLDLILSDVTQQSLFKEFSNYPSVERDFSALVPESINAEKIRKLVIKIAKPLLRDIRFFDVYKGSRVPEGHVSYAFQITLASSDHTLTDVEINEIQEKIMQSMEKEFNAKFAGL